jgi:nickel transport system substrate-binding protein
VSYGEGGQVLPSLAESWKIVESGTGEKYTFTLREGVTFHDDTEWNCMAAKMNFDHVFAGDLKTPDWHGWYGVPLYIDEWECEDDMTFVITTTIKYAPFLQELGYIRPLRMLSPTAFAEGVDTNPNTHNSCHVGWGTIASENDDVVCAGIAYVSGTGPFSLESRNTEGDIDTEVIFTANSNYWNGAPAFDTLKVVHYNDSNEAKDALIDGDLDVIWGSGVLPDKDISAMQDDDDLVGEIQFFHSRDFQNAILLLNSGNPPLNDINLRKTIIHAIDKSAIVEKELGGLQKVVDNVFPRDAPNCDVDLTPRWDYDFEKASLLFCDDHDDEEKEKGSSKALALGLGLGLGGLFLIAVGAVVVVNNKRVKVEDELNKLRRNKLGEDA